MEFWQNLTNGLNGGGSRGCVAQTTAKYTNKSKRVSPPYPANECCGQIKEGNDGRDYISKADKNGVCKWVAFGPGLTGTMTKKRQPANAATKSKVVVRKVAATKKVASKSKVAVRKVAATKSKTKSKVAVRKVAATKSKTKSKVAVRKVAATKSKVVVRKVAAATKKVKALTIKGTKVTMLVNIYLQNRDEEDPYRPYNQDDCNCIIRWYKNMLKTHYNVYLETFAITNVKDRMFKITFTLTEKGKTAFDNAEGIAGSILDADPSGNYPIKMKNGVEYLIAASYVR